jgi:serine/threonine protein phosphatase 1
MTTSHSASDTATSKPRRSTRAHAAATASRGDTGSHPATTRPRRRRQRSATPVLQVTGTCPVVAFGTQPVVAFGDVHGSASLLEQELEKHYGSGAELIFLGDLIDRSPEPDGDRRVLERIWALQRQPELWGLAAVTVLRGNHEQMLLDAIDEGRPGPNWHLWISNGGDQELLPWLQEHRDWLAGLPHTAIRGTHLFVHAGVRPGVPLKQQKDDDLIWIRKPFLNRHHGLPYTVVHGHSITEEYGIERHPHRINLDSGAFISGILSSLRLEPNELAAAYVTPAAPAVRKRSAHGMATRNTTTRSMATRSSSARGSASHGTTPRQQAASAA